VKLILVDLDAEICEAWRTAFQELPNVEIVHNRFETIANYDCMVSAANSFGLMDGGVDLAITRFFGDQLMDRVQQFIVREYLGEQPVGTSFIIETKHPKHKWLAHTPTMRVPMQISGTDNVYVAMAAMLRAVYQHNLSHDEQIESIACPGLGTGTGLMPPKEAARQMALAYRYYLNPPPYITWQMAGERQTAIRYGGTFGFQIPTS
jgi:O-acetyl-ADP-ribose deacetylase (regulator of RNase III)